MLKHIFNASWLGVEYAWYPLLVFLTTPYFLEELGVKYYGLWVLLNGMVGFGVLFNAGTSIAVIKQISHHIGKAAHPEIESTFRSSLAVAFCGGGILAVLIFSLLFFWGHIFFESMGSDYDFHLMAFTAFILLWLEQADNVVSSTLKAAEKFGILAKIELLVKTLQVSLALLAVTYFEGLVALYLGLICMTFLRLMFKLVVINKVLGINNFRPNFNGARSVLLMAKWGWLQGVGSILFGVADRFLIGSVLGASSLTYYSLASQLAQQSHGLIAAAMSFVFPLVSRGLAKDPTSSLKFIYRYSTLICLIVAGIITAIIFSVSDRILSAWLGQHMVAQVSPILKILAIAYGFLALNIVPNYFLLGMGKIREVAIVNLVGGCVMLGYMAFSISSYELTGVGAARIAYGLITSCALIFIFRHYAAFHKFNQKK